jgi:hypothetical protein
MIFNSIGAHNEPESVQKRYSPNKKAFSEQKIPFEVLFAYLTIS